jgi:hypothetical protein
MYKFASDEGFRSGLMAWVFFLLLFLLAGFRAELCILFGAMAGLAVWNIIGYVQAEEVTADPEAEATEPQPSVFRQVGIRLFDRIRRPVLPKETESEESPSQASRGSGGLRIGSKRPSKRYIGRRPPKRIGK